MGADDVVLPANRTLARHFDPKDVPTIAWGLVLTILGFGMAVGMGMQFGYERPFWALLIGVIVPFGISLGFLMPFGLLLVLPLQGLRDRNVRFFRRIGPWMAGWILVGMVWMGIAGAGSVIYQSQHGLFDPDAIFLVAIFATYGAIPGAITGYYYGRTAQTASEVAERERYLAVFSRVLRHNFRNQMNLLLGHLDLASRQATPGVDSHVTKAEQYGEDLMETVEKQRFLVEVVTDPKSPRPQTLSTVVETALETVQPQHPKADVRTRNLDGYRITAHPAIDRAVAELVENAIRHCPDEHPRILIEGGRTNGRVVLSVSDSGPAIPSTETDILTKELEPDQLTHGSGLGLWIVDRLTEQSNGQLAIERTEGVGNTVILELPSESG